MKLVVDGRALVGNRTGIGVHAAAIAARLPFDPAPLIATHAPVANRSGIEHLRFRTDSMPLGVAWQQLRLPRVLREEEADVLWGPHGTLPLAPGGPPAVVTLHDFTSITGAHRHEAKTVVSFNLFIGRSLARAAVIAAVSRATAEEAWRGFGVPLARIEIVPNGVGPEFTPAGDASAPPLGLDADEYVLFVGTLEPRKGIGDLLDAWEGLAPRPRLVLCGGEGWGLGRDRRRIERHRRDGAIVVTGFVGGTDLVSLYRHARMFVYPSRHEGFGLPPLEAMACGTPVVATAAGAIPEVTGDAALLVAPGDPLALRRAIERVARDVSLRREMAARGIERAKLFSWDRSAAIMADLIRRAARF
ncbi:MAG: glycosyltransferase family 4 protein [Thermoanaerobaculia bacterium]